MASRRRNVSVARRAARRGRGIRGPLFPPVVPARRTRSEQFDFAVLEAFAPIDERWHDQLTNLDIAVDTVPPMPPGAYDGDTFDTIAWPPEVYTLGGPPLARLIPAGVDARGNPTRARIVVFRQPHEWSTRTPVKQRPGHLKSDPVVLRTVLRGTLATMVGQYLGLDAIEVLPELDDGWD